MRIVEAALNRLNILIENKIVSAEENKILEYLTRKSRNDIDPRLKIKILEILKLLIKKSKKPFGMIIILGWRREWNEKYAAILDETQNMFEDKNYNLKDLSLQKAVKLFLSLKDFDGAVLINREGKIIASGVYLINLNPKKCLEKLKLKGEDLSEAFGFKEKVHTRHITAITASLLLDNTTVFTVSEESQTIRIYENGKIIYSTLKAEIEEILGKISKIENNQA